MSKVTGTGCMCTSLIGSYLGAGDNNLIAALSRDCFNGYCRRNSL